VHHDHLAAGLVGLHDAVGFLYLLKAEGSDGLYIDPSYIILPRPNPCSQRDVIHEEKKSRAK
jgi:hypothetical protein